MRKYILLASVIGLSISCAYADRVADQMLDLAQNGVTSPTAAGEPQTTVVDENGNLKMVPVDSVKGNQSKNANAKMPSNMATPNGPPGSTPPTPPPMPGSNPSQTMPSPSSPGDMNGTYSSSPNR